MATVKKTAVKKTAKKTAVKKTAKKTAVSKFVDRVVSEKKPSAKLLPAQSLEYIMMEDLLTKDPEHYNNFMERYGSNPEATFVLNFKTAIPYSVYQEYMSNL